MTVLDTGKGFLFLVWQLLVVGVAVCIAKLIVWLLIILLVGNKQHTAIPVDTELQYIIMITAMLLVFYQFHAKKKISVRPYISIDAMPDGDEYFVQIENSSITSFYTNQEYMDRSNDGTLYKHNNYKHVLKIQKCCKFAFSNMGEGSAYRLSIINLQRFVKDDEGQRQHHADKDAFCKVINNTLLLPNSKKLPVNKQLDVTGYDFKDDTSITFCIDVGPSANQEIIVRFYDLYNTPYVQRFVKIQNDNTPGTYRNRICRYCSEPPLPEMLFWMRYFSLRALYYFAKTFSP